MKQAHMKLSSIYKKRQSDREIFQDLMRFKVQDILLIATHYDAYCIEEEGAFFERIIGEFLQLNLYTAPRIRSVHTQEDAEVALAKGDYQLVIIMAGLDKKAPVALSEELKKQCPDIPIILLANNNSDLAYFKAEGMESQYIDRVFVWNGDLKIFLAITKYIEDKTNVRRDTRLGDVRVILLVEDSVRYYTRYLPMLYSIVMQQTQDIINEKDIDEEQKILQMRARPKVILCTNYNEAVEVVDQYSGNLLTVISDVTFEKDGIVTQDAGVQLLEYVKTYADIPCLLQSSDPKNEERAGKHVFLHKNSDKLGYEVSQFMKHKLGFGPFVFKGTRSEALMKANTIEEFINGIATVKAESLSYHAQRNSFSTWLMARGQINLAKRLRPFNLEDFDGIENLREKMLDFFKDQSLQKLRGRIINYSPALDLNPRYITRLGHGSIGGKGRGLAFVCNFIENIDFKNIIPKLNITMPLTSVVGTEEYDFFMEENKLTYEELFVISELELKKRFTNSKFHPKLKGRLRSLLKKMNKPLAVRSSGLFEDSLLQPFSGIYATYVIPNNHEDIEVRLEQLCYAIKLVYASIYSQDSRNYFEAVDYKVEEEKMAVIIQELVGSESNGKFYAQISGVADSFNYYPFAYMEPEDGFAVLALGLGMYNAGGERSYRFCPKYPKLEIKDIPDQIKDSQNYFYALDMNNQDLSSLLEAEDGNIIKCSLADAEADGRLASCAQVFDFQNDRFGFDFTKKGARVLNFASIIKYNSLPLSQALVVLLQCFSDAMGAPVQMEFAVDMNPNPNNGLPSLQILQIKPMIQRNTEELVNIVEGKREDLLFQGEKGMGNGIIDHIQDVLVMDTTVFDRTVTEQMAVEVAAINKQLEQEGREYVLIGPGRWGTRDKFTGIPVTWAQIANAKVIIEMGLKDFPLEASLGSHFFHNVTSMNVGYFSVPYGCTYSQINFDVLSKGEEVPTPYQYFKLIRFKKPLTVMMDGRRRKSLIMINT